jgi:hypothetical protein
MFWHPIFKISFLSGSDRCKAVLFYYVMLRSDVLCLFRLLFFLFCYFLCYFLICSDVLINDHFVICFDGRFFVLQCFTLFYLILLFYVLIPDVICPNLNRSVF